MNSSEESNPLRLPEPSAPQAPSSVQSQPAVAYNANSSAYPQVAVIQLSLGPNARHEFIQRLNQLYPLAFVAIVSSLLLFSNTALLILIASYNITLNISNNTLNSMFISKYSLLVSVSNIGFSLLALVTSKNCEKSFTFDNEISDDLFLIFQVKVRVYYIIQLTTILHFIAFFASGYYLVCYNALLLLINLFGRSCESICLTVQFIKLGFGSFSTLLAILFFIKMQNKYLNKLNRRPAMMTRPV